MQLGENNKQTVEQLRNKLIDRDHHLVIGL
jgi:hypothetical protein